MTRPHHRPSALIKGALLLILGAIAAAGLTPASCSAESTAISANEQAMAEELKSQEDPTILKRRIWSDTEWNKYKDGSHDIEETLGALWAWRLSDSQEWAIRLKVPFKFHIAGDSAGNSGEQGLRDIKMAAGTAFWLRESWRIAAAVEMRFPSASDDLFRSISQPPTISGRKSAGLGGD